MRRTLSLLVALTIHLGTAELASADVPPPNECGTEGTDCENAPPDYHSPGTCTKTSCSKKNYATGETSAYECNLCVASNRPRKRKGRLGCATAPPGTRGGTEGAGLLLLAALALGRRAPCRGGRSAS